MAMDRDGAYKMPTEWYVQVLGGNHITREYEIRGWEILYPRIDGYDYGYG